jgi:hypothetical protein
MFKRIIMSAVVVAAAATAAQDVDAAPIDADIMFVIDQSGSMSGEFSFLAGAISGFLSDLQADARIGTARAGLISYETNPTLHSDLTTDAAALSAAFAGVPIFGGFENAYRAVDSALPGGNTDFSLSYDPNAVKSVVLITDEDQDGFYSNGFGTGAAALGDYLDDAGFLNNIIFDQTFGTSVADFEPVARPNTGLFSIADFRTDRTAFFEEFTRTKITEIVDAGGGASPIPLPATLPLLLGGLVGLGVISARRRAA